MGGAWERSFRWRRMGKLLKAGILSWGLKKGLYFHRCTGKKEFKQRP